MKDLGNVIAALESQLNITKTRNALSYTKGSTFLQCSRSMGSADVSVRLTEDEGMSKAVDSVTYQLVVGSLLYASIVTRPDIARAVGAVAKFCSRYTN